MDTKEIEEMLREDQMQWSLLSEVLDSHPSESLHDPESPQWNSRDVYAHLARWMELSTGQLKARISGTSIPRVEGTDDEINARWQQEDSRLSLAEARGWAQRAFDKRVQSIRSVPADRWDGQLERTARGDGSEHYATHREFIAAPRGPL